MWSFLCDFFCPVIWKSAEELKKSKSSQFYSENSSIWLKICSIFKTSSYNTNSVQVALYGASIQFCLFIQQLESEYLISGNYHNEIS